MPPPSNRNELEHNVYLVLEDTNKKVESGNQEAIQNVMWATAPHLEKVEILPNGRINLVTINETIRLQANMMDWTERFPLPQFKKNDISE